MVFGRTAVTEVKTAPRQVAITVRAPGAKDVQIAGDFNGWGKEKLRLRPVANGEWRGVLELLPGEYQYRLLVDGQWRDHAEAARRVRNAFGTENCVLVVA